MAHPFDLPGMPWEEPVTPEDLEYQRVRSHMNRHNDDWGDGYDTGVRHRYASHPTVPAYNLGMLGNRLGLHSLEMWDEYWDGDYRFTIIESNCVTCEERNPWKGKRFRPEELVYGVNFMLRGLEKLDLVTLDPDHRHPLDVTWEYEERVWRDKNPLPEAWAM